MLIRSLQITAVDLKVIVLFYYICSVFMAATYAIAGGIIWRVSG